MNKMRINLANPQELLEIPGIDKPRGDAILRHRAKSGPIKDAAQLAEILGGESVTPALLEHVDFAPADSTAPEAPGA
jgi:DNA uptake protein ComE-like DNA-binding protein